MQIFGEIQTKTRQKVCVGKKKTDWKKGERKNLSERAQQRKIEQIDKTRKKRVTKDK